MDYYFLYNEATGQIIAANTAGFIPGTGEAVLSFPIAMASTTVIVAFSFYGRFIVQNGQLVEQPYLALAVAQSGADYVITASLNNPAATPPASATFTVARTILTEPIANGMATLNLGVHPSVSQEAIAVAVAATGCVGGQVQIGGTGSDIGLQVYTPSGGIPTVVPGGPGSEAFLTAYCFGPQQQVQGLEVAAEQGELALQGMIKLLNWATTSPTTPLSLSTVEQTALAALTAQLVPNMPITLGTITIDQIEAMEQVNIQGGQALAAFEQDMQIPNLQ